MISLNVDISLKSVKENSLYLFSPNFLLHNKTANLLLPDLNFVELISRVLLSSRDLLPEYA
jgi:hypothetical protein